MSAMSIVHEGALLRAASMLAASLLLACASPQQSPGTETPRPSAPAVSPPDPTASEPELVSIRPGVNDRYFEANAISRLSAEFDGERRDVIARRDEIVAALELEPGMIVADIGAGTGAFLAPLSAGIGADGTLYAVDIVPAFLEHLRARADTEKLQNVEVIEGTPTAAMLPGASVDLMFMCDVYHHLEYPSVYARSLHRALRADGRLIVVEFERIPGKTSPGMLKHVRQDKATLIAELAAEGFVLEREITDVPLRENYMLVFHK
jgi:ubiquinone/menaquinone biosynthesis C-methylase UbiE